MTPEDATVLARRVMDIGDDIAELTAQEERLARERAGIIQMFRQDGWSLGKIATAMGLSRSRVAQIAGSVTGPR